MGWIERREGKNGITYRLSVQDGNTVRRITWKPTENMTARQADKAADAALVEFEKSVQQGYQLDNRQTFAEYAAYVIDLKERSGKAPRTVDRYRELLVRINAAIGDLKLADVRPQHLNALYKNLSEAGIRADCGQATAKINLAACLKRKGLSICETARRAGAAASTVSAAVHGQSISAAKAEAIAVVLDMKPADVFTLQYDHAPLSSKTVLEYHRLCSTIFAQAEKEMLIPYNPAAKATPPKVQRKEPEYFQPEQVDAILDALDAVAPLKWHTITYLLIDTGARRGEIAGLKWECVDLESGVLFIKRALLYNAKRGVYEGPPKNGKSRAVKVSAETLALLKFHRKAQLDLQTANGDRWTETGYCFTQDDGRAMNPDSITIWLDKFAKENGLPHIHPHMFRHTAASVMIADGVDLATVAAELGHANMTTTANIYTHQIQEARAKAENARAGILSHRREAKKA